MKVSVNGQSMYIDENLKVNLDRAKEISRKDWDILFLYDGYEGSGKSVKAMQDAFYMDPTFTLDRMCFTPREFTKIVRNSKEYESIVYDEAYTGLSSRAAMSLINRTLIKMLAEIRQRKLFVAIVMPSFFDLDKYAAIWRSRALIHIYTGPNFQRGFFAFYNMYKKKVLYVNGKKFYNYSNPSPNFRGRFTNFYPVDEQQYRKVKRESLTARHSSEDDAIINEMARKMVFERLMQIPDITNKKRAEILDVSEQTYYNWIRKFRRKRKERKKINRKDKTKTSKKIRSCYNTIRRI